MHLLLSFIGIHRNELSDIYCDKSTHIAYLRYWAVKRAGITPYLNSEGKPARCNEVHR
jgi:hypothetical protein